MDYGDININIGGSNNGQVTYNNNINNNPKRFDTNLRDLQVGIGGNGVEGGIG